MTMPDERYRAMVEGMKLIQDLLIPQVTPRVPTHIRERARWVMRHYPSAYEFELLARQSPDMLATKDFNGKEIK
jgi:hypothetical protein